MKLYFAAMAAALAAVSTGCTSMNSCGPGCGQACHITQSQAAPRAGILEGRCHNGPGLLGKLGWHGSSYAGCGGCVEGCGECVDGYAACGDGGGGGLFSRGGCGDGSCGGNGCLQQGLGKLLDCNGCGPGDRNYNFAPGPPVGQVAYPYYTTRGPRDFLMANPPSIGPR